MINFLINLFNNASGAILDFFGSLVPSSFIQLYFLENPDEWSNTVEVFSHVNYFLPLRNILSFIEVFSVFAVAYVLFRVVFVFVKGKLLK